MRLQLSRLLLWRLYNSTLISPDTPCDMLSGVDFILPLGDRRFLSNNMAWWYQCLCQWMVRSSSTINNTMDWYHKQGTGKSCWHLNTCNRQTKQNRQWAHNMTQEFVHDSFILVFALLWLTITVASQERNGVSNRKHLDCLCNRINK